MGVDIPSPDRAEPKSSPRSPVVGAEVPAAPSLAVVARRPRLRPRLRKRGELERPVKSQPLLVYSTESPILLSAYAIYVYTSCDAYAIYVYTSSDPPPSSNAAAPLQ
jgi:hypothetical protein